MNFYFDTKVKMSRKRQAEDNLEGPQRPERLIAQHDTNMVKQLVQLDTSPQVQVNNQTYNVPIFVTYYGKDEKYFIQMIYRYYDNLTDHTKASVNFIMGRQTYEGSAGKLNVGFKNNQNSVSTLLKSKILYRTISSEFEIDPENPIPPCSCMKFTFEFKVGGTTSEITHNIYIVEDFAIRGSPVPFTYTGEGSSVKRQVFLYLCKLMYAQRIPNFKFFVSMDDNIGETRYRFVGESLMNIDLYRTSVIITYLDSIKYFCNYWDDRERTRNALRDPRIDRVSNLSVDSVIKTINKEQIDRTYLVGIEKNEDANMTSIGFTPSVDKFLVFNMEIIDKLSREENKKVNYRPEYVRFGDDIMFYLQLQNGHIFKNGRISMRYITEAEIKGYRIRVESPQSIPNCFPFYQRYKESFREVTKEKCIGKDSVIPIPIPARSIEVMIQGSGTRELYSLKNVKSFKITDIYTSITASGTSRRELLSRDNECKFEYISIEPIRGNKYFVPWASLFFISEAQRKLRVMSQFCYDFKSDNQIKFTELVGSIRSELKKKKTLMNLPFNCSNLKEFFMINNLSHSKFELYDYVFYILFTLRNALTNKDDIKVALNQIGVRELSEGDLNKMINEVFDANDTEDEDDIEDVDMQSNGSIENSDVEMASDNGSEYADINEGSDQESEYSDINEASDQESEYSDTDEGSEYIDSDED